MKKIIAVLFLFCVIGGCADAETKSLAQTDKSSFTRGPADAALKIEQFSDFHCPYCRKQSAVFTELNKIYPGKIQMAFRHFPLSGEPGVGTFPLHEASVCAAEQNRFWDFHDFVFQSEENLDGESVAERIKLDMNAFKNCMKAERGRAVVSQDLAEARTRGVDGVPAFFMNGESHSGLKPFSFFASLLDPEFADKAEAEKKARDDELKSRIDFSDTGRPSQGPADAPVTLIEFSDFHCYYCQKLTPAMDEIMKKYEGKVRRVWRHFPLPIHPQSPYAHVASECALQQGKFWEFHNTVFSDPAKAHTAEDFKFIADDLKLDRKAFDSCYENDATKKKVENDVLMGFYNKVGSTPTLMVNGKKYVGAKPANELTAIIDEALTQNDPS